MNKCLLCQKIVEKLKSNSHIIPRWAMAAIKDEGRFVAFENRQVKNKQTDLKADIVCEKCERRFKDDDDFGAQFYRDRKHYKFTKFDTLNRILPENEYHDESTKIPLLSFIVSIILRSHLFYQQQGIDLLGSDFENIRTTYLRGDLRRSNFFAITYRMKALEGATAPAIKSKHSSCATIEIVIFGYHSILFLEKELLYTTFPNIVVTRELIVPILNGFNHRIGRVFDSMCKNYELKITNDKKMERRALARNARN